LNSVVGAIILKDSDKWSFTIQINATIQYQTEKKNVPSEFEMGLAFDSAAMNDNRNITTDGDIVVVISFV